MPSTTTEHILITGATGHLGFQVLLQALTAGHRVLAVARTESKAQKLLSHPLLAPYLPNLSTTLVPDFLAPSAFVPALENNPSLTSVIHVASPIASALPAGTAPSAEEQFINPAVKGTLNVLTAVHSSPTSKNITRIVITSSIVALLPQEYFSNPAAFSPSAKPDFTLTPSSRFPYPTAPYGDGSPISQYAASKAAALLSAEKFLRDHNPSFDVVHVHPSYIFGRDHYSTTALPDFQSGTNRILVNAFAPRPEGEESSSLGGMLNTWTHVHDAARLHVQSLDRGRVAQTQGQAHSFISSTDDARDWKEVGEIVRRDFKKEVQDGKLSDGSVSYDTVGLKIDNSQTKNVFGRYEFALEATVAEVAGHYLELQAKEKAGK